MSTPPPETIELRAGMLTRIADSDAEEFADAVDASLEHLRPWMPWANRAAAQAGTQRARIREADAEWARGAAYIYALRPAPAEPLIGTFGLHRRIGPDAMEIGYWMHVDFTGHGYATAAAGAVTAAGLALDGVRWIEIHTDEANTASAAIPRRLGYRLDRVDVRRPEAPGESGRLQIWIADGSVPGS